MAPPVSSSSNSKSKFSLRSHLLSFLLGASCTYMISFMKPTAGCAPVPTMTTTFGKQAMVSINAINTTKPDEASKEKSFKKIGNKMGTDKVQGPDRLVGCLANPNSCTRKGCVREECRPWWVYYYTSDISQRIIRIFTRVQTASSHSNHTSYSGVTGIIQSTKSE